MLNIISFVISRDSDFNIMLVYYTEKNSGIKKYIIIAIRNHTKKNIINDNGIK